MHRIEDYRLELKRHFRIQHEEKRSAEDTWYLFCMIFYEMKDFCKNKLSSLKLYSRTKKLPVNVIVNVNVIGQPTATAEFHWHQSLLHLSARFYIYYKSLRTTFLVRELSLIQDKRNQEINPYNFYWAIAVLSSLSAIFHSCMSNK